ncbi:uncharacterized protein LOC109536057 isoform X3 [Dendroctonus ponderosae]|uniref:uncharacterized protein LOC109536057 isoform X3 n=1 Tax=Dendroctonus ponderosae TaxID=77166 RepID=UPI002036076E|nr:uncharacterized protein LOC109536057 isoform X3 [Dendroctonus ponderosae]
MIAANVLCLKKKKKRTYSLSSCKGDGAGTSKNDSSRNDRVTMIPITEDTPPDMLAGAMDLTVHLPSGKSVKMSVERSTPMMDLLVQVTTTNHLQLSNHTLQVLGMAPSSEHNDKVLLFKPNTPIGTLDTQHIRVLPKERTLPAPKYSAPGHQPFESTFRLKVHLPRNQLYVTRVSRNVLLEDIMKKVCGEKNLDPTKYDFKHPGNLDQILDPKFTLSDYQITEIYVVAKGTTNLNQAFSAADIMVLRKEEERKQMHNKAGGGVFNLIFKRGKSSMGSGSVSSDNRSISPTQSDDSRSVTPPVVQPPPERPKPPQRKRRPAPKPPQAPEASSTKKTIDNGLTICHSRNSSDSSGYHEASILSDHCANASLPRMRPKSAFVGDLVTAQGSSNLNTMVPHSRSTTSLVTGRKKKAAPPPPPPAAISPASSVVTQSANPSPLVASQSDNSAQSESATSATLPLEQTPRDSPPLPLQQQEKSLDSADSGTRLSGKGDREEGFQTPPPPPLLDEIEADAPPLPVTPPPQLIKLEAELVDVDWQYQLPSPPGAFRDSSPVPIVGPESDFKDSVVTSPELFEKLKSLEESQSVRSETSEEPLNTLTLEHLEKRKSLVYNRELATSLKMTDSLESSAKSSEAFASSRGGFQIDPDKPKHPPKPARSQSQHYTLPNFKISTYDVPKHQNIKVFEDDTIRSSTHLGKTHLEESVWKRHSVDEAPKEHATQASAVSRSGSFSSDSRTPLKPVSRSKSTLTLNKYQAGRKEAGTNMSRSNSLFDVSGLQSLEVMKLIQNKLNTPPGSQEQLPREEPHDDTHASPKPVRKFYRGPPAVNMSTWSERPKVPVAVKADEDYKLGNASKPQEEHGGAEITQKSGNVVIRIGANKSSLLGPAGYRRPLANLNGSTRPVQRPHSIALDLSRVPVVRSMELKKPFQEAQTGNTSITHLNQDQEEFKSLQSHYGENDPDRRVFRAGSFRPVDVQGAPVVRGFKSGSIEINNRLSWNPSMTLPARSQMDKGFNTNQFVPFSQSVLRRTESSKRYIPDPKPVGSCTSLPPPPPEMPRVVLRRAAPQERNQISPSDPRDQLLESIRNFGGKKGLRAAKV